MNNLKKLSKDIEKKLAAKSSDLPLAKQTLQALSHATDLLKRLNDTGSIPGAYEAGAKAYNIVDTLVNKLSH